MADNKSEDKRMHEKSPVLIKSKDRVQKHGEVFTPKWLVNQMIEIPGIKEKADDIFATFLEPSAGEGAFLTAIEEIKLEHVKAKYRGALWDVHALWAISSIYGIEYLEDNLKVARQKMLELFCNYFEKVHGTSISKKSDIYKSAETIIRVNIVQGDTLSHKNDSGEEVVFSQWKREDKQSNRVIRTIFSYSSLFGKGDISKDGIQTDCFDAINKPENGNSSQECYAPIDIQFVWKEKKEMNEKKNVKFKFDVVIGNPPYQEEAVGKGTQTPPIYHKFMDEAYEIAERVSFITPARFLYNAGATPKVWNRKMLEDEHLKIKYFEQDSSKVFSNTDIKGGVVVTYRDAKSNFGAVGTFTAFQELNRILDKVKKKNIESIKGIFYNRGAYRYTEKVDTDFPDERARAQGENEYRVETHAFDRLNFIFFDNKPDDGHEYIQLLGLQNNKRTYKWIRSEYVSEHESLKKYKIFLPKSNGSGALGEVLSTPLIGTTETFLTVGSFNTKNEANALLKYICTKFARVLLGVLKITQDNTSEKWKYVPLQDFTSKSDIDWSKSVREIDRQLYKKYDLDESEIEFIESHVKEMK